MSWGSSGSRCRIWPLLYQGGALPRLRKPRAVHGGCGPSQAVGWTGFPGSAGGYVRTNSQSPRPHRHLLARDMMADTPPGPTQRTRHKAPTTTADNATAPTRMRPGRTVTAAGTRPSKDRDSLASILAGMRTLARDLRHNPAAAGYAQQCER